MFRKSKAIDVKGSSSRISMPSSFMVCEARYQQNKARVQKRESEKKRELESLSKYVENFQKAKENLNIFFVNQRNRNNPPCSFENENGSQCGKQF